MTVVLGVRYMDVAIFERFVKEGSLTIVGANGSRQRFGSGAPRAAMRFSDATTLARILRNPQLNLGETYMAGRWDITEGSLHDLLTILRINLECQDSPSRLSTRLRAIFGAWNHIAASRKNVRHHYDLDESLFRACLDQDMHYSCAYFRDSQMSLEAAQRAKCEHIAGKLQLKSGLKILDIGCGWGSLAMDLARRHDVHVTGITLSQEQLRVAEAEAHARGLADRVRFELQDYREHQGRYDRVVSVGMFEHVGRRHYPAFFNKVAELLDSTGIALIHTIASSAPPAPVNPWISRYIFPGGYIPSLSDVAPAVEKAGMITADLEVLRNHYALTLAHWNERFQAHRAQFVRAKGESFCRMWEFYLAACQTAFEISDLVVHHWQLCRQNLAVPITRDYLYRAAPRSHRPPSRVSVLRQTNGAGEWDTKASR